MQLRPAIGGVAASAVGLRTAPWGDGAGDLRTRSPALLFDFRFGASLARRFGDSGIAISGCPFGSSTNSARQRSSFYAIVLALLSVSRSAVAMARDVNPLKSELITLSVNVQTAWYLDRLVETGLYGNNRTEAARVALYDHCKMLIANGRLEIAPRLPSKQVAVSG